METELRNLRIDRKSKPARGARWLVPLVLLLIAAGAVGLVYANRSAPIELDVVRVQAASPTAQQAGDVVLSATGYIIAAHRIELASKVVGKVAWIGVEKGNRVHEGQVLVRLEDDEYRAHLLEAEGQLNTLKARLAELVNGSRPEEIAKANADVAQSKADLENARVNLDRTRSLASEKVVAKQVLDDAQARYDGQVARTVALERTQDLVRLGARRETIDAMRAQVQQAQGSLDYARTQLDNTVIRAPISGTILQRNVERGEFVTTGFVGDRGAKGYVVSMADLKDLQVELDINQNDFAKLGSRQAGIITTDAYPDRKYQGAIEEVAPEGNRQKATVQVKVRVQAPDDLLRPEMNATVQFVATAKPRETKAPVPRIVIPVTAVRDSAVFVVVNGRAARRSIQVANTTSQGAQVISGLTGGEDLIVKPPADLKEGQPVRSKQG
jgi:HlyD family secretion protein